MAAAPGWNRALSDPGPTRCPGCGTGNVVLNGSGGGEQRFRCRTKWCGLQFMQSGRAYHRRFSADVIARAIELYLAGLPYRHIAGLVERQFDITDTRISEATILRWVRDCVGLALEIAGREAPQTSGNWCMEFAPLAHADGGIWLVIDEEFGYILLARIAEAFDESTAERIFGLARAGLSRKNSGPLQLTLLTEPDVVGTEVHRLVVAGLGNLLPKDGWPVEVGKLWSVSGYGHDRINRKVLPALQTQRRFRSPTARQRFLDAWVFTCNHLASLDEDGEQTAAHRAGIDLPWRSWQDVIDYRVTSPARRTARKNDPPTEMQNEEWQL